MASKDKDLSLVDYRQRLIYFKDADAERNSMIHVKETVLTALSATAYQFLRQGLTEKL